MSSRGCMVAEKHTTPRSDFVTSPKYSPISSAKAWMVLFFLPCQSQAYSVVSRRRARTKESSGSQFYIVWGKVYKAAELKQLEHQLKMQQEQNIFNALAMERREEIMNLRRNRDREGLMELSSIFTLPPLQASAARVRVLKRRAHQSHLSILSSSMFFYVNRLQSTDNRLYS